MSLRLKKIDVTPGKSKFGRGWHYVAPDGTLINGGDIGNLLKNVMEYRVANQMPFDTIEADVHDWLCRNTQSKCAPPKPLIPGEPRTVTVADVWRFLKAMVAWIRAGTLVDQDEAERRAEICAGCRFQTETSMPCVGCTGIPGMINAIVGQRKTRMDHALKHCGVCACVNRVQIWAPLDVLLRGTGDLEMPADTNGQGLPCWKRN